MEYQYENLEAGIRYFKNVLDQKESRIITETNLVNNNRHAILKLEGDEKVYLMFKKSSFDTWLKYYPQLESMKDDIERVDSMNLTIFKELLKKKDIFYIFIVYGDGRIIKISKTDWLGRAKNNGLYRKIEDEQHINSRDYTGSITHENNNITSCYFIKEDYWF